MLQHEAQTIGISHRDTDLFSPTSCVCRAHNKMEMMNQLALMQLKTKGHNPQNSVFSYVAIFSLQEHWSSWEIISLICGSCSIWHQ